MPQYFEGRSAIVYNPMSGNGNSFDAARQLHEQTGADLLDFLDLLPLSLEALQKKIRDIQRLFVFSGDGSFLSLVSMLQQLNDAVTRIMIACGGGGANVVAMSMGTKKKQLELFEQSVLGTLQVVPLSPFSVSLDGGCARPANWTITGGFSTYILELIEKGRKNGKGDLQRRLSAIWYGITSMQDSSRVSISRSGQLPTEVMGASVTAAMIPWWSDKIKFPVLGNAAALLQILNTPEAIESGRISYMVRISLELILMTAGLHRVPRKIVKSMPIGYGETVEMTPSSRLASLDSEIVPARYVRVEMVRPNSATNTVLLGTRKRLPGSVALSTVQNFGVHAQAQVR